MTLQDRLCFTAIMVGFIVFMSFIFFGCAGTAHANQSPFSGTVGENFGLVWCSDADKKIAEMSERREELIHLQDSTLGSEEFRASLDSKIQILTTYIGEVEFWKSDNCTGA